MSNIKVGDIIQATYECRVGCISYYPLDAEGWCSKCQRDNEYHARVEAEKREALRAQRDADRALMRFYISYLERNL